MKYAALFFIVMVGFASVALAESDQSAAAVAITRAERDMAQMQESGFGISRVNDTINEARLLFSQGNYVGAESVAKFVGTIKEKAMTISNLTDEAELKIYESGVRELDVSPARELFDRAMESLDAERYEEAGDLLEQSIAKVDELEAEKSMEAFGKSTGERASAFLTENWNTIIIIAACVSVTGIVTFKRKEASRLAKKVGRLENEKLAVEELMRKAQCSYFTSGQLSKGEYFAKCENYQKRLIGIRKEMSVLSKPKRPGITRRVSLMFSRKSVALPAPMKKSPAPAISSEHAPRKRAPRKNKGNEWDVLERKYGNLNRKTKNKP